MEILIGIAAGMAFVAFLTAFLAWISITNRLMVLGVQMKDYLLITPDRPGVKGAISAQLFEAMKEVCEAAKAQRQAESDHDQAKENKTGLVGDIQLCWDEYMKTMRQFKAAVDRLAKIEELTK